ncbi:MAG TPA: glycosyltransferase [Candidatus Didemnitutus sp.]|nr:glycosyltransferase [Candidatus Didemnitutus sp.]
MTKSHAAGPTSILILHATAGAGHMRAAQAIGAALAAKGRDHRVVDTLEYTTALFRRMYAKSYIDLVQTAPELWGYIYEKTDSAKPIGTRQSRARLAFDKLNAGAFKHLLAETQPDLVVCTHFLPLELLSDLKKRGRIATPVHSIITDVSPHAYWVHSHIDHTYVATASTARELARKGYPSERITVTGIPVDPVFAHRTPAPAARLKLGLPERPTALLLSGGFGVGPMKDMLASFRNSRSDLSLVVVAGRNATLEKECRALAATLPFPVTVHGFVNNMHELMDAADLIVTKPGGLTTTEILAKGKPMALVAPIPGQEQRNCEYLLGEGAAVRLYDVADAAYYLENWFADEARLKRMAAAARAIARPDAALTIASALVAALPKSTR